MPRTSCPEHGVLVLDKHPFGRQNTHYSFQLEVLIMTKAKNVSIRTLSIELREPDSNIWGTIHRYIKQGVQKTDCSKTTSFGVDEKSYQKGLRYVSIFTDHGTGKVIDVCEGRDQSVFSQCYQKLYGHSRSPQLHQADQHGHVQKLQEWTKDLFQ